MLIYVLDLIAAKHRRFIDTFIKNKRRFSAMLPVTFAKHIEGYIIPCSIIVKFGT